MGNLREGRESVGQITPGRKSGTTTGAEAHNGRPTRPLWSGAPLPAMRKRTWSVALPLAAAIALAPSGCGRARRALERSPQAVVRPTERRIDAVLGRTLVVPVALEGAVNPARGVRVRL